MQRRNVWPIKPDTPEVLPIEIFLSMWIAELQRKHARGKTDKRLMFMVRGYDYVNSTPEVADWFSEVNIFDDEPGNLLDGTWYDPQIWSARKS